LKPSWPDSFVNLKKKQPPGNSGWLFFSGRRGGNCPDRSLTINAILIF
jgi:hypothetical protein